MEIIVSVFAVLVGLGCFIAIYRSDRKDKKKTEAPEKDEGQA